MTRKMIGLIVAYAFPPTGGAGVQRLSKLAKYLPLYDIEPQALTVSNPSVPLMDPTLTADLPSGMLVTTARTLEPSYRSKQSAWEIASVAPPSVRQRLARLATTAVRHLAFPDVQVLWLPGAWLALRGLMRGADSPDVVFISGPPFSPFLLSASARRQGAAVVLDYRDEWRLIREQMEMTRSHLSIWFGDRLEASVLARAHMVTTATEEYRVSLLERFPFLRPEQVVMVPNGFDPSDFPAQLRTQPPDRFRVTFAGTVYRVNRPSGLLAAVREVHRLDPDLASLLELRFIGRVVESEKDALRAMESHGVTMLPYMAHRELLDELSSSHLTLCILDDVPGADRIYPGKVFELMYLGRPCLILCPDGALARLVTETHLGTRFHPDDVSGITSYLLDCLRSFRDAPAVCRSEVSDEVSRFDRRVTAGVFASTMRAALAAASRRPS